MPTLTPTLTDFEFRSVFGEEFSDLVKEAVARGQTEVLDLSQTVEETTVHLHMAYLDEDVVAFGLWYEGLPEPEEPVLYHNMFGNYEGIEVRINGGELLKLRNGSFNFDPLMDMFAFTRVPEGTPGEPADVSVRFSLELVDPHRFVGPFEFQFTM
jgi:hypothetical protein